jgi:hypothetical protein
MPARKTTDSMDRQKILRERTFIDPLDTNSHLPAFVNIANGMIVPRKVNAGTQQYESSWQEVFHRPHNNRVVSMSVTKKQVKVGETPVYHTRLIYTKVMGLQPSSLSYHNY